MAKTEKSTKSKKASAETQAKREAALEKARAARRRTKPMSQMSPDELIALAEKRREEQSEVTEGVDKTHGVVAARMDLILNNDAANPSDLGALKDEVNEFVKAVRRLWVAQNRPAIARGDDAPAPNDLSGVSGAPAEGDAPAEGEGDAPAETPAEGEGEGETAETEAATA